MATLAVTFLGSGDAFGSGGRLQTCMLVRTATSRFLVDCGTTVLIAMRRLSIDPNSIAMICVSHLHGDHFGGIPFFLLDAQLISKRTQPLLIAGPPGTQQRLLQAMEVLFPGSSKVQQRFAVRIVELLPACPTALGDVTVTPYVVQHASGAPPFALRIACAGKIITYSGDTEWTDALIPAVQGADLCIAEAYFFDKQVRFHLDYHTLMSHLEALRPKRLILTHMSADMLARLETLTCEYADDGKVVEL
jgi:ribonuclease BN (tRNA processing enzyme)